MRGLPELNPIGLHNCRHTYVSLMFDAGLTLERIGDYVGNSSAYMTDHYRHLLDGHEAEVASRFDEYLERADEAAKAAKVTPPTPPTVAPTVAHLAEKAHG